MLLKKKNEFYGKEKKCILAFLFGFKCYKNKVSTYICILKKRAKFENILKQMCFLYYESH